MAYHATFLFLDIRSAYYKIVRQFAFDLDNSDLGVLTLLHRLGIEQHIDDVATALKEQSTLRQPAMPRAPASHGDHLP